MNDFIGEDQTGTLVARDMLTLLLCGFVACAVLAVPFMNDPKKADAQTSGSINPPGNVIVDAQWPDNWRTDVDLWVQAPGDTPVGYSNKGGLIMNLLRDDLGSNNPTPLRYENQFSRSVPPGEYTINLHLFRNLEAKYPVPVDVTVRCSAEQNARNVVNTRVQLDREGQELTALRFRLDEQCNLAPNSVHSVFKPLRSPGKT
ncbi:hypothetical protein N825_16480 [Skermanella stibiiresistens SB22]|uniref:Uncharacterized protein n=1 Tax=Skermanella stibiiresistens SB22 TaxID=1385369 RepID=W9GYX6_9PROT|nr:hypothetical protein [Skermanella stibiiresistens]EWY37647.1 hypothetical protein N825_16480 [Skermanella stibiiresistens SB22]